MLYKICLYVAAALLSSALGNFAALAQEAKLQRPKPSARPYSIVITSNVKDAGITEDELFLGHAGNAIDTVPGVHEILVTAPGYIPRLIRVLLTDAKPHIKIHVGLAPAPNSTKNDKLVIEIDYAAVKTFKVQLAIASLPSLCAEYKKAKVSVPQDKSFICDRSSIIDDFAYFGTPWLTTELPKDEDPAVSKQRDLLVNNLGSANSDQYYWAAENFYSFLPGDPQAANLAAYSALRRQDCVRALQIVLENGSYQKVNPGMLMIRGLCTELSGQTSLAAKMYWQAALNSKTKTDILYHYARSMRRDDIGAAIKALNVCAEFHPQDYRCYEAAAQLQAIKGNAAAAARVMSVYHQRAEKDFIKLFSLGDGSKISRDDLAKVQKAYSDRPYNFELIAAYQIALKNETNATIKGPEFNINKTVISSSEATKWLVPQIETINDIKFRISTYKLLSKHYPGESLYEARLSSLYRDAGECQNALDVAEAAAIKSKDELTQQSLLLIKNDCYMRLGKLNEAAKTLISLIEIHQNNWKNFYNLGVIQEKIGKMEDAALSFNKTLEFDIPENLRIKIDSWLSFYHRKNSKNSH